MKVYNVMSDTINRHGKHQSFGWQCMPKCCPNSIDNHKKANNNFIIRTDNKRMESFTGTLEENQKLLHMTETDLQQAF